MIHSQVHNQRTVSASVQPSRPITLATGHVFQGQITKIFPNNVAALSMNGMNVTARLEAALTAGQRYWFEVQEGTGIPRLRVLDDNTFRQREGLSTQPSVDRLMQQLGLPQSKGMETFIRQLSEQQIPFTRQSVLAGAQLLNELNQFNDKGFRTLMNMMERQLPLTKETFQAFEAVSKQPSVSQQLQQLSTQLSQSAHPAAQQVSELVANLLKPGAFQSTQSPIPQLLSMYTGQGISSEARQGAEQLLTRLGVIPEGTNPSQVYDQFKQALLNPANREIVSQLWPNVASGQGMDLSKLDAKVVFETMISRLSVPAGKEGISQLQQLLSLLQTKEQATEVQARWIQLPTQSLIPSERLVLQQTLEATTSFQGQVSEARTTAGAHLQSVLQMLGYQHEHDVTRFLQGDLTKENLTSERLKAMLLHLQQEELPTALKEQVNQTLHRLTGQQMLAQDQTGPLHQMIMQIPLSLGAYQTDMTMQWEGRKQANGELDPAFCRILFYLTLERLEETIVDVQIQNRIIAVTVFNEQEKPQALIDLLIPSLKRSLNEQNYQLLSVKWKTMKEAQAPQQQTQHMYQQSVSYQGVDVRI
ncbi:hypothetical protein [Halalkalibacter nanhaiisediminis]|uniref:Flagellar hook-length control protein FliK n=1 Tax=Halalkalibacter nanhaiisediminis TaxID=688079 RepID=A0A562QEI8_9BACI|nr:hypothetical protein [Halalkalibacter nanhaiisediminis]TWI55141.1 hypothetical protein IQ10_02688 [Halalkalibacter nanhaiisediminis]